MPESLFKYSCRRKARVPLTGHFWMTASILIPSGWVLLGGKNRTNLIRINFMVKETERLPNTVERFWYIKPV